MTGGGPSFDGVETASRIVVRWQGELLGTIFSVSRSLGLVESSEFRSSEPLSSRLTPIAITHAEWCLVVAVRERSTFVRL